MTKENIDALTQKLYAETGKGYSVCYAGAENALTVFEGITEENAWESSQSILSGIPAGDTWSTIFRAGTKNAVGLISYGEFVSVLRGVLFGV